MGRLREELREVGEQRDRLASQVTENQDLSHVLDLLNEKHKAAQHEVLALTSLLHLSSVCLLSLIQPTLIVMPLSWSAHKQAIRNAMALYQDVS